MSEFNQVQTTQPTGRCVATFPRGDLRPELAAFFVKASRETTPRRINSETGILAELRAQGGCN